MRNYNIKLDEYGIGKNEFLELKAFCLQYSRKKKRLHQLNGAVLEKAKEDIKLIEDTAEEVDAFLKDYIIKSVTDNISTWVLIETLNMPESRDKFNKKRRQFFFLLAKRKNMI